MKCPRCKGKLFSEKYYEFVRSFDAWKCIACGEIFDPVILANRARNITTHADEACAEFLSVADAHKAQGLDHGGKFVSAWSKVGSTLR